MNTNSNSIFASLPVSVRHTTATQRWLRVSSALTLLLVLTAVMIGCQTTPRAGSAADVPSAAATAAPATQLREGDVIHIVFEAETNLNSVAKIQLDGTVVLPMLGGVKAAGKTLQDLQTDLQKSYKQFIKTSDLTVTLASTSACVYISGAVLRPGRIALDRPLTAMEAIMEAGGFDLNRAKPSDVSVLRVVNGSQKRYRLNLKSALREGDTQPFQLQPFDIVHVPEKTFNL
jgi:polysaccharide biosynthesis/export protein